MLLALLLLAGAVASTGGSAGRAAAPRPNIVLVLTDDLSWNLVRYMPHVRQMRRQGVTFSRYFVTDSLCCPSRASIFTGRFPHNTRIFTNLAPDGGFRVFRNRGEERSTFATALKARGYRTAMMGKYLNGYRPANPVPPGWTEWDVAGNGYREFNYRLSQNGRRVDYGNRPGDYLTDVIARKGSEFIESAASAHKPFILELATFAPHAPYTPAPRDAGDFPGLKAPRGPAFNADNRHPPKWLRNKAPQRRLRSRTSTRPSGSAPRRSRPSTISSPASRRRSSPAGWRAIPTSCSAPTTVIIWASTSSRPASRPPSTPTSGCR